MIETNTDTKQLQGVFEAITNDDRYKMGIKWGEPRKGHPEGTIADHIAELEDNLTEMHPKLTDEEYWKLCILIHVHDTLKCHAQPRVPITHRYSHASLAADFLSEFIKDDDLIAMVQFHDESFALYRQFEEKGKFNEDRFLKLIATIKDWKLFLAFNIIDNCTAGKERKSLRWFIGEVRKKIDPGIDENWILR